MNKLSEPFSVLISIFKDDHPRFLQAALSSIFENQTLRPEQVVIVADGELGSDQLQVINQFINDLSDNVVTFVQIPRNVGLATALNTGLYQCRNEIVARMDADDISLPRRFEKQIRFMSEHPDIDVCGTLIDEIDTLTEQYIATRKVPLLHDDIVIFARKRSAVSHPSVMFRKSKVLAVGGYPPFRKSQDFALWSLLIVNKARFANLPEVLLKMRTGQDLMTRRGIGYLKYEYQVLAFQHKIGFINTSQFYKFALLRTIFRIMPGGLKKALYGFVRKCNG